MANNNESPNSRARRYLLDYDNDSDSSSDASARAQIFLNGSPVQRVTTWDDAFNTPSSSHPTHSSPIPNSVHQWLHPDWASPIQSGAAILVYESDNDTNDDWSINDDVTHVSDSDGWSDAEDIFEFLAEQPSVAAVQQGPRRVPLEPATNTEDNLHSARLQPAERIFSRLATVGLTIPARPANYPTIPTPRFPHPNLQFVDAPNNFFCTICQDDSVNMAITLHPCSAHHFHMRCLLEMYARSDLHCPLCRQEAPL
jgi:hypothetical protein